MGTFNAGTVLESLDYDFTDMAGEPNLIEGLAQAKGTIKEPTRLQFQQFMRDSAREHQRLIAEAQKDAEADGDGSGSEEKGDSPADELAAISAGMARADMRKAETARKNDAAMLSKLCSGNPSTEILLLLPHRVYIAFSQWLYKELSDPEAVTGGGAPHLKMLKSPAAG